MNYDREGVVFWFVDIAAVPCPRFIQMLRGMLGAERSGLEGSMVAYQMYPLVRGML